MKTELEFKGQKFTVESPRPRLWIFTLAEGQHGFAGTKRAAIARAHYTINTEIRRQELCKQPK